MKDFVSKVTFGFLMAQLLPGAIVVFAITCAIYADSAQPVATLKDLILNVGQSWFKSTLTTVAFLFLATAIGMLIHGLNWTVLAWLENRDDPKKPKPVRERLWHQWPVIFQLLVAPGIMTFEILHMIACARNLNYLTMDENISKLNEQQMPQFIFLQEFYLHFGQFFAHSGYAFLLTFACGLICTIRVFTVRRLGLLAVFYFLTSIFFLLGRIQLGSLFKAENVLRDRAAEGK